MATPQRSMGNTVEGGDGSIAQSNEKPGRRRGSAAVAVGGTGAKYDASAITKLEGVEAVRKNPGMYIGGTGPEGLHHLIWEVVDNSVDEALAGECSQIEVRLLEDGGCSVEDDGRGIPVDRSENLGGRTALEVVLTEIHAGGKFTKQGYKVSGGLHGVGLTAVNAVSARLEAVVWRDGFTWRQSFEKGKPTGPPERLEATSKRGTKITFWPDPEVFRTTEFDIRLIEQRLKETAYLVKGLQITLVDESRSPQLKRTFKFDGGVRQLVEELNHTKEPLHKRVCDFEGYRSEDGASAEIALQWNRGYTEAIVSFANTINTPNGGSHEQGFKKSLTSVINRYARQTGILKDKDENFLGEDVRQGLTAVISVRLTDPQYEGQTKSRLVNPELEGFVQQLANQEISRWLEEYPDEANLIVRKIAEAAKDRMELERKRKQDRQKSLLEAGSALPGKLADCSSKDPSKRELFIVEGDSAGGSAIKARDREHQAILPIRGKILNVEKARLQKALDNQEIRNLVLAIGCGIGENIDLSKLKYHKICILCDADVDGAHIRVLLLTFFYRFMPELIREGHIYVCRPPLYKASRGKRAVYLLDDREKEEFLAAEKDPDKWDFSRHKGLGEMDAEELWITTMDPARRSMFQITIEDAALAEQIVSTLMGEESRERKEFIAENAEAVGMLDI
jgi:DNA gyrase subunit B